MSVHAFHPGLGAAGDTLADALPGLDELAGPGAIEPDRDAAAMRLEPLAMPPALAVAVALPWARPIDPRARVLFESLGARASELLARSPRVELGAHEEVLDGSVRAVALMVATLSELGALERDAALARRRGAMRA